MQYQRVRLGIDFGTTRTVVACADRGNYPVLAFVDDNGDSHDWIPSVVTDRNGSLAFGWEAVNAQSSENDVVVRSFKRLLADAEARHDRRVQIGRISIPLADLIARFLEHVKESILERSTLKEELKSEPIRSVVAVPANSAGAQRLLTLDAFRRAGLAPVAMLNEPSAAGFEYTHRHRSTLTSKRDHVVVYDLGGGTFDASLVRMRGLSHEVLTTAGDNRLGGDDFDSVILELVLKAAGNPSDVDAIALREACREAKERLNPSSKKLTVDVNDTTVSVPVQDIYDACTPLVDRSIEAMLPVMKRLEGEDGAAGEDRDDIAGIYVVGGASELPIVGRQLKARFGRRVHRSPYASGAIAIGLAIACDEAAGFELIDRYTRTFGVFREGSDGTSITFDPIFTRETVLPAAGAAPIAFRRRYRAAHNVGHYRFLECSAMDDSGRPRGHMVYSGDILFPFEPRLIAKGAKDTTALDGIQVTRMNGEGPRIEEEYTLDEHGIVAVRIKNLDADFERVFRIGA